MLVDEVADYSVHHIYDKDNYDVVDMEVDTDSELANTIPNEEAPTKKKEYAQCKTPETRRIGKSPRSSWMQSKGWKERLQKMMLGCFIRGTEERD